MENQLKFKQNHPNHKSDCLGLIWGLGQVFNRQFQSSFLLSLL